MKALLIQYTVLYSKMGYSVAASVLAEYLRGGMQLYTWLEVLDQVQNELAYAGAPAWLYESLMWHIAEHTERMQANQ